MLTFKNLQDRVLRLLDEAGDTSTTLELTKDFLNASHRRVLNSSQWGWMLWPREESFVTQSGIRIYALNPAVGRLRYVWDVTQRVFVPVYPERQWEVSGIDRSVNSVQGYGIARGPIWPVQYQPTDTTISIVSTDVGDASTFYLEGINTSNELVSEIVSCTGTTPVVTSTVWRALHRVTVGGTPTGTRTLTSGSTTLLSLTSSQVGKLYPTLEFLEYPAVGRTYTYHFRQDVPTLSRDNDLPFIFPNSCAEILVYDALLDYSTYNTELTEQHIKVWKARYDAIWKQLTEANDEQSTIGAVPRTVRDLDGYMPRRLISTG